MSSAPKPKSAPMIHSAVGAPPPVPPVVTGVGMGSGAGVADGSGVGVAVGSGVCVAVGSGVDVVPHIDETLDSLAKISLFSNLDLALSYWQEVLARERLLTFSALVGTTNSM